MEEVPTMKNQNDGCMGCVSVMLSLPVLGLGCLYLILVIGLIFEFMKWVFTLLF